MILVFVVLKKAVLSCHSLPNITPQCSHGIVQTRVEEVAAWIPDCVRLDYKIDIFYFSVTHVLRNKDYM